MLFGISDLRALKMVFLPLNRRLSRALFCYPLVVRLTACARPFSDPKTHHKVVT
jgi:hypothetical protein